MVHGIREGEGASEDLTVFSLAALLRDGAEKMRKNQERVAKRERAMSIAATASCQLPFAGMIDAKACGARAMSR